MLDTPFSPWPSFTQEEADAVSLVLLSNRVNYWTGRECREFEMEFAAWTGCEHAVALANGTVALDLALHVLGIGPGDDVVVTPRTFIASVSCVVNAGARPIFADVDRDSQNITAESIHAVLTPLTRAVICVHLAGMPCDMDPIMALACREGTPRHRGLCPGPRCLVQGTLCRFARRSERMVVLSGQNHHHGRRRGNAYHEPS